METPLDIFASPNKVFTRVQFKPVWLTTTLLTTLCLFLLVWLGGCWTDLSRAFDWSNLLPPALISPVIVGIVSLGTTAFVYLLTQILGGREVRATDFKTLYSVNIHCGIIFLLGEVINFLFVRTNILGDHPAPLRGRFPVGLDLLLLGVDDPNLYLSVVLHSTSFFLIWYLVVLALGIRIVAGVSKSRAIGIALILWCTFVLLSLGAVYAAGGSTSIRIKL